MDEEAAEPVWTTRSTTDPEEGYRWTASLYADHRVRFTGDRADFYCGLGVASAGTLAFSRMRHTLGLTADVDPLGAVFVTRVRRGGLAVAARGDEIAHTAGDVYLNLPTERQRLSWHDVELEAVHLDLAAVDAHAAAATGAPAGSLVFHDPRPASPGLAEHWRRTAAYALDVLADPLAAGSPLIVGRVTELLVAALISVFPNSAVDRVEREPEPRREISEARLRRLVGWVDEHAGDPIGIDDVAGVAHVRRPDLDRAFRRRHNQSVARYLWGARLDGAHRDLLAASPGGDEPGAVARVVAEVAARWGFDNVGRFGVAYRHHFGITPEAAVHR